MRRLVTSLVILTVFVCAAAGIAAFVVWQRIHTPHKGYQAAEQFIDIPAGTGTAAIGRRLVDAGVIRDPFTFRAALWWSGRSRALQAGEYRFDRPLAASDVVDRLVRGDIYARRITFPEGLTIQEMARVYEAREFGAASAFLEAARNASLIRDLEQQKRNSRGFEVFGRLASGFTLPEARAEMLAIAWKLIPEAPWVGHGLRPFSEIVAGSTAGIAEDSSAARFAHVHNEYFNNLLKMGIVGTVLFYAPMALALILAGRRLNSPGQRLYAIAILWVVGAHLIFGLTGVFFEHAANALLFGVYLGMLVWLVSGGEEMAQAVAAR